MTIHMTKIRNMQKYYDNVYSIFAKRLKLNKKPTAKIPSAIGKCILRIVLSALWLTMALFVNLTRAEHDTNYILTWVFVGLIGSVFITSVIYLVSFHKTVQLAKRVEADAYLTVDENGVTLDNRVAQQITALQWQDIRCVIVTKNIVCFLAHFQKNTPSKMSICCDITYKNEILSAVEQYGYGHLIVEKKR